MRPARWIVGVAAALAAVTVLTFAGHPGADYRHGDFFQFWAAPRLLLEGRDPYDPTAWADIYAREASVPVATPPPPGRHIYPLWSAVPLLPFAALPFDLAAALWAVGQVATVVLALRALASMFGLPRPERIVLFGLAVAFQPLWLIVGGGNVTGYLLGAFVAALASVMRRPTLAGGALALLALKPHPFAVAAPALLLAARPADRVRLMAGAAVVFALLVAMTLPLGPSWIAAWIDAAVERQLAPTGSNATVWTIGRVLPGEPLIGPLLVATALAGLALWWRSSGAGPRTCVAGAVPVSLFVAPHGWSYDQVVLLVPLAAILAELAAITGARRVIGLLLTAGLAGPVPWVLYALAFTRPGEEWSALTPLAFFGLLVLMGLWSGPRVASRARR